MVSEIKKRGGLALKFTSQFHRGIPDRIVLLPFHTMSFVELKSTGESPTKLQESAINKLIGLGFKCWVIDSHERLDAFLEVMDRRLRKCEKKINDFVEEQR